ncbi:hypothetical protein EV645_7992 [Kribbella rubisoli]|uniref:Uncharacterized protein n=1 Tax=Kribbella rubisoli TaxID=3075929 RepID=A0A4Q7VZ48_9ACTN|nr:hypothetical protein [Kribbella rubisoli]RZU01888.1 hypothetical protein EV645_7992 [Kribbella rubisoli]
MDSPLTDIHADNGDSVARAQIAAAVTAGRLGYADGATQIFERNGATTYTEDGHVTRGEWYVDDRGRFCSFWPPSYRACYLLQWLVEDGVIVGLTFVDLSGRSRFDGRYR